MLEPNPFFNYGSEVVGPFYDLVCFRVRCNGRGHIVDHIALSPAGLEVIGERQCFAANSNSGSLKGHFVVSGSGTDSVSRAGDRNRRRLQSCVIGCRKSPVRGQCDDTGIGQISCDQSPKVINFLFAGLVRLDVTLSQPLLPTRHRSPSQILCGLVGRWLENGLGSVPSLRTLWKNKR